MIEVEGFDDISEIGRGGFAVVYRARQVTLNRVVALKLLSQLELTDDMLRRFAHEAEALGRLSGHPSIVTVYLTGTTTDGVPYLAMEYVPGGSLGTQLRSSGPLAAPEAVALGQQLGEALHFGHAKGVIHRDVKPDNVLVGTSGRYKLTDFGIAALDSGVRTRTGTFVGSLAYAAPEVLNGERANEASDVYGLGATLYAALCGHAPFAKTYGDSAMAIAARIAGTSPAPLGPFGVPRPVERAVMAAMSRDVGERPSLDELREMLDSAGRATTIEPMGAVPSTSSTSIVATTSSDPTTTSTPALRSHRRRRGVAVVAGLLGIVGVTVTAVALAGNDRRAQTALTPTSTTASTTPTAEPVTTVATATTAEPVTTVATVAIVATPTSAAPSTASVPPSSPTSTQTTSTAGATTTTRAPQPGDCVTDAAFNRQRNSDGRFRSVLRCDLTQPGAEVHQRTSVSSPVIGKLTNVSVYFFCRVDGDPVEFPVNGVTVASTQWARAQLTATEANGPVPVDGWVSASWFKSQIHSLRYCPPTEQPKPAG